MRKMDDSSTEQELISVECDGSGLHLLPGKLQVLILGSEWGSSKGGLSAINRELTINLAKCPEVHVSFYVPQCNGEEIEAARYHNIDLIKAERRPGMAELQWLLSPPPDLHIDVVVGHGVELGPQAQFIREVRKCKWIQIVHKNPEETGMFRTGLDAASESEKEHEHEVALCKKADFVLTVGPKLAEAFRAYLRSCNQTIFEFTPGILQDVSKVHQVPEEGNKFRVLLCGRGDTKDFSLQGFDIAAKAVALSDSHLVYVGAEGNENELKKRFLECEISAKSLTIRSTVKNRESLNELLCEVDLAVMPTRSDGFGVIGLEALSASLPVLVSRNSGFGEALIKVSFGSSFVIDLEDVFDDAQVVQEWTKMIKKVKGKDRSQRLEESEALRTFYEKKYSWEKQSKDLVREIIKMIQDAPTGCHCSTQHKMSQQTGGPEDVSEHLPGTLQMEFSLKSATFQEAQTGHLESVMLEMARHFIDTVAAKIPAESMPESFYYYLAGVRDVAVKRASHGSLRVTVECKTPDVLDSLWKDYRSGNLNAEAEKRLLTDDIKREFHVVSVKLQTTIRIVDYLACKLFLTSFPQSDEDQTTDETQTQSVEEPEPVTQNADINYSADNRGGSNQLRTEKDELETTRKQINKQQGQEEQLTQEQNPATKVQIQLQTEQIQSEAMEEQLKECPGEPEPGELLRQQSQLRTMEKELKTTRKELSEYQAKEQLLRQQGYELQSQLRTRTDELKTTRAEWLRECQEQEQLSKQLHELQVQLRRYHDQEQAWLLKQQEQQVHELQSQLRRKEEDVEVTRRLLSEWQQQDQLLRQRGPQELVHELQSQLRTREQDLLATKERLYESQEQAELLELKRRLQTRERDLEETRKLLNECEEQLRIRGADLEALVRRMNKYKEQEQEQLKQVHELRRKIGRMRIGQNLRATRREPIEVHERRGRLRRREQELETTSDPPETFRPRSQETFKSQGDLKTKDWVIHRNEIQLDEVIAIGDWGQVFRGRFRGRDVAVKKMIVSPLSGFTARGFVERQVDIASKCHHPCLLQFIGATADNDDDHRPLFVTEFMGTDCCLKTRLYQRGFPREKPTITEEDATVVSLDVARALNYLHQKSLPVIHYNISSGKVLLWRRDEQWRAKLSGYETMNFRSESSRKGVQYRAPELLTEDPHPPISFKVDVYSFGVLLCEMSIRQEPDPQQRRMQIAQIRNCHFRKLVQRCVQEEPGERPNMEEVIQDLETVM